VQSHMAVSYRTKIQDTDHLVEPDRFLIRNAIFSSGLIVPNAMSRSDCTKRHVAHWRHRCIKQVRVAELKLELVEQYSKSHRTC
jgi:hypothetical protein